LAGKRYSISIPAFARSAFSEGKARLWRRFEEQEVGEAWVARIKSDLKALKAGGQAKAIGIDRARDISFTAAQGLYLDTADLAPRSRKWYGEVIGGRLDPFFGPMKVSQIGRAAIESYFVHRRKSKMSSSPDALFKDLTILRIVLKWARDHEYTVDDSAWYGRKPKVTRKVRRVYDRAAVERFLKAAKGRDRALIEVALATGMRRNELKFFHTSWIMWDQGTIRIPADETFAPKDREPRNIPMNPRLEKVLRSWLGRRREGPVFPPLRRGASGNGQAAGPDLIGVFRRVRTASGVPFSGWHDLRHHYISLLFHLKRPIPEVMAITGHSHMATVAKYAHASQEHLRDVRDALEAGPSVTEPVTDKKSRKSAKSRKR
jgi:integrase